MLNLDKKSYSFKINKRNYFIFSQVFPDKKMKLRIAQKITKIVRNYFATI